jgi:hypothetical protein
MAYLCTECEEDVLPTVEPPSGWRSGDVRFVVLDCFHCGKRTVHIPDHPEWHKRTHLEEDEEEKDDSLPYDSDIEGLDSY